MLTPQVVALGGTVKELITSIEIDGAPEAVWTALMDFGAYPEWNPFILEISGDAVIDGQLNVRLQNPGGRAMTFTPTVTVADPPHRFSWMGKLGVKGVFDGHHRFGIEPTANGSVVFTQSEEFSGFLVPILWGMVNSKTRAGFESMNAALKERVESRWECAE